MSPEHSMKEKINNNGLNQEIPKMLLDFLPGACTMTDAMEAYLKIKSIIIDLWNKYN